MDYCGSAFIWSEIQKAISSVLDKYTVYDLISREYKGGNFIREME